MPARSKRYYVEESFSDALFNAGIIRKEHEKILQSEGYQPLRFLQAGLPAPLLQTLRFLQACWFAVRLPAGSRVIFHFPLLAGAYGVFLKLLQVRGIHTTGIVIDIDGLRYNQPSLLKKECSRLRQFHSLVVHNSRMAGWLCPHIPGINTAAIGLFDHPGKSAAQMRIHESVICYAGNLSKAGFIKGLQDLHPVRFHLYGEGAPSDIPKENISCHAPQPPASLPGLLEGSYGLIWDGPSIHTCDPYLQYNTPHKASLYLLAGLPLIVWAKSALADMVEKEELGFTVEKLDELPEKLASISMEQYTLWRSRVTEKGQLLSQGKQLLSVLQQLDQD